MAKRIGLDDFDKIFQQYKDMVFKTAYLTVGNVQEAEDILQEVFLKVYESGGTFDPAKGSMSTWLHRITVNHCISGKRKKRLTSYSSDEMMEESGFDIADVTAEVPGEMLIEQEECSEMWQAINSIDKKHRAVLALRYFDGLSYDEIARALNMPLGTVKSRLNVAIKNLRSQMAKGE
ncbi:MAG: RNA polymerase sigma factor [Chloroflexi bacterium]|nr:RNA polymerase sigma factor [Chloroflexota bacterium]MBT7081131.1 RNA polymerase sigma factor [Chloroflexota bacterium]MBT7289299.1 RNA polymerase sigma factor [Chloroflexota bacterium]